MTHALLVFVVLVLMAPRDAAAYIDPGAGSMILQLILGGFVAGLLVVGKLYYRRLLAFFRRTPPDAEQGAGPER
jgi:hypothetical protein